MKKILNRFDFRTIRKSKFLRSVFLRIVAIFLIVIIGVVTIAFFSFTSEINKDILNDRERQLSVIENTMSSRMQEAEKIAYKISVDDTFYMGLINEGKASGYEMVNMLSRYLVGNDFISYLAYYRLSEPDKIYASCGEYTYEDFYSIYLNFESCTSVEYLELVKSNTGVKSIPQLLTNTGELYFSYITPVPALSATPQAYVIMLIPISEFSTLFETLLTDARGKIAAYDASGSEVYSFCTADGVSELNLLSDEYNERSTIDGREYLIQKKVSQSNGWTYASLVRLNDIVSEAATNQLIFIVLLLVLMVVAIVLMLVCVIIQYKPINELAAKLNKAQNDGVIDEKALISNVFTTLQVDSEQKKQFENAYYEADAANKAKSAFLSNMSHDIRTPMNAIVGMTELAIKHLENPEYVKECLNKVRISSRYLLDIINNVLDISRIESGKFTLASETVDLPELVNGVITILNHSFEEKNQNFIVEVNDIDNEKILGDGVRISQVFMNILSNAVKFTPENGKIRFSMTQNASYENGYGDYVFTFSDTGIGMSPQFVGQVFDTFSRDKKTDRSRTEGTGLGMAIAKNLVEMMGGTIKCKSELGKGTTFIVTMHLKLADYGIEEKIRGYRAKYQNIRVLILGSEKEICENQAKLFNGLGTDAEIALDVSKAARMTGGAYSEGKAYKYVIINQTEDDRDGIAALTHIKSEIGASDTTFVLVARDMISVDRSSQVNAGIANIVQFPLFKSTVLALFDRSSEIEKGREEYRSRKALDLTGRRVLLVEDNDINREIAFMILSETNAEIVQAENGEEAVALFKDNEAGYFDIILMDLQMPVMNGFEAASAIRNMKKPDSRTIPIYAMTANTFDEDVRQVKEAGMNGHLGKPYVPSELFGMLKRALLNRNAV